MNNNDGISNQIPNIKSTAAGQYLGYAIQPVRLFYHLLTCPPEASVSLEYVDDVAVHLNGEVIVAEQCKSALSSNPVSNWAVDLWKTFSNWIDLAENSVVDLNSCSLQLYVTPKKPARNSQSLSDLSTEKEVAALFAKIKKQRDSQKSVPKCSHLIDRMLELEDVQRVGLVSAFTLINEHDDPLTPIKNHLASTVRTDIIEIACKFGIGKALEEINNLIGSNQPPVIEANRFRKQFQAFLSKHDSERYLHSFSEIPPDEIVAKTIANAPVFIRQLEWIEAGLDSKTRAASDYLRTSADRTAWAAEGKIFEPSLTDYDHELLRRYSNVKTELSVTASALTEEQTGLLLYSRCCQAAPVPLEQKEVPGHFLTGSLNSLADRKSLGWHPDYEAKLEALGDG